MNCLIRIVRKGVGYPFFQGPITIREGITMRNVYVVFFLATFIGLAACGTDDRLGADAGGAKDPMSIFGVPVRTEGVRIPPNPVTGDETPESFQKGLFYRYRLNAGDPVRAILLLIPGGSAGANNYDYMARELIRMSRGAVEVWAYERRPNMLEDLTGMNAAEAAGDPGIAVDYYYGGREVNGRTFSGFLAQEDVPFLSEWGLKSMMDDLRAAVELIPEDRRRTNLIVGGHSMGVVFTMCYMGWDFDGLKATLGDTGYNQAAGAFLLDAPAAAYPPLYRRSKYAAQVRRIRSGAEARYQGFFPVLTPEALAFAEIIGMLAHPHFDDPLDPDDGPLGRSRAAEIPYGEDAKNFLEPVFAESFLDQWLELPPTFRDFNLTNEALLGLCLDDNFQPITAMHVSAGFVSPSEQTKSRTFPTIELPIVGITQGYVPSNPQTAYSWRNYDDVEGIAQTSPEEEVTDVARAAEALWRGPTNYLEWYYALRPHTDILATGGLHDLNPEDWQAEEYGLNVFHVSRVDVPILVMGAEGGMVPDPELFESLRNAVADPARGGIPRSSEDAFKVRMLPGQGHFDVLLADNSVEGGNGVFGEILDFVLQHSEGEVLVP